MIEQISPLFNLVINKFASNFIVGSEYYPRCKFGEIIDSVRNKDIEHLSFVDNTFDLIVSNDVMEHITNPKTGFRECARVLRKGGKLLMTVPF